MLAHLAAGGCGDGARTATATAAAVEEEELEEVDAVMGAEKDTLSALAVKIDSPAQLLALELEPGVLVWEPHEEGAL